MTPPAFSYNNLTPTKVRVFLYGQKRSCYTNYEKTKAFYPALRPYFLDYDLAEMEKRLRAGVR